MNANTYLTGCILLFTLEAVAGPLVVTIPERDYETGFWGPYFRQVLELALEATVPTHGPYETSMWDVSTQRQERELYEIESGNGLDITWSMTSREREAALLPIRIPLVKGLLGYRVSFVNRTDSNLLARITSLDELSHLTAGQGLGWPDAEILANNKLPVVEGRDFEGLFGMLRKHRFDYFPRGITEVWDEAVFAGDDLVVDKHLLLYYPTAVYFFVNRNAVHLAERIESGMEIIIRDGRFDLLFNKMNGDAINKSAISTRTIITLTNPLLPPETPLCRKELWFDPELH